ncbi:hypothetical protein BHE74_00015838 [Ensete ventricosum]|nr:hypothetical protein BHE74_00015838 [Ensete ventricosum]
MYKITCRLPDDATVSEIMSVEDDKSSLSAPGTSTSSDAATVVDVGLCVSNRSDLEDRRGGTNSGKMDEEDITTSASEANGFAGFSPGRYAADEKAFRFRREGNLLLLYLSLRYVML